MKVNPLFLADRQNDRGWTGRMNVRVNAIYSGHWQVGHIQASRVSDDHELVCLMGGETEVIIGDRVHRCRGGEALIKPPGVAQFTRAVAAPVDRICIHFDWDRSRKAGEAPPFTYLRDGVPDTKRFKLTPKWVGVAVPLHVRFPDRTFRARALEVPQILEADDSAIGLARLEAIVTDLILRLVHAPLADQPSAAEPDDIAIRAKEAIETRFTKDISLAELATELGTSASHLSRRFRTRFGVTAIGYLQEQRLQMAYDLLQSGSCSVASVAHSVGISDPNYFARVFSRRWGVAPSGVFGMKAARPT
jgi:AraC-like DNA-binding protein